MGRKEEEIGGKYANCEKNRRREEDKSSPNELFWEKDTAERF